MHALAGTIYALASPPGRGGVAVLRVSGPAARAAVERLTGRAVPAARRAAVRTLRDPASGEDIDRGLMLWFAGPSSFTGEDVAEFHVHGGRAVVQGLLGALAAVAGCRLAEPGEFTRRAFENGKLDLTAAEAVADLVAAETAAQRRQALRQLDGALADLYEGWRARLLRVLAHLEADIDFPDEDLPQGIAATVRPELQRLADEIAAHLADGRRGERLRQGLYVAIVGPPNAGKSSLLNLLAQREVAIVAETAGTTRDVIEVHLDLAGWPVTLADTAGLRETQDAVEREGVRRAQVRARQADLRLWVVDATAPESLRAFAGQAEAHDLLVINKVDLADEGFRPEDFGAGLPLAAPIALSVRAGRNVETLLARLQATVEDLLGRTGGAALTRERHREALGECRAALQRALAQSPESVETELVAEDVRLAVRALGRITGRVDVESLLDVIFREFCIGK